MRAPAHAILHTHISLRNLAGIANVSLSQLSSSLQITGDNVLIARETARALGMGMDIRTAELLPQMMGDGRMPPHLGRDYGHVVLPADGFAQVRDAAAHVVLKPECTAVIHAPLSWGSGAAGCRA